MNIELLLEIWNSPDPTMLLLTAIGTLLGALVGVGFLAYKILQKELAQKIVNAIGALYNKIFRWSSYHRIYRERLAEKHAQVPVLGKEEMIPLDGIFTDVYLLDELTANRRYSLEALQANPTSRQERNPSERKDGLKVIHQVEYQRLLVFGKPGAGKTTFMRYIVRQASKGNLHGWLPIFVSLKQWSRQSISLMEFLVQQFDIYSFPNAQSFIEAQLDKNNVIVLFDGLDEISKEAEDRARARQEIEDFCEKYRGNRFIITCRIAAVEYIFPGFVMVEVADFNQDQVSSYVKNWFAEKSDRQKFLEDFVKEENSGMRELASSPLLLSLLCLAYEENPDFAQERTEIYGLALNALLYKWDRIQGVSNRPGNSFYRQMNDGRKKQMFAKIAEQSFQAGEYYLDEKELSKRIEKHLQRLPGCPDNLEGRDVLKTIEHRHGIFTEQAKDIYSFAHLSFHEYFTACYIQEEGDRGLSALAEHITDRRWRQVILFTAGLISRNNGDNFIEYYRNQLSQQIVNEPKILELLQWAKQRAVTVGEGFNTTGVHSFYLSLALIPNVDRTINHDLKSAKYLNRSLDLARAIAIELESIFSDKKYQELEKTFILNPDVVHMLDLVCQSDLKNIFELDQTLIDLWRIVYFICLDPENIRNNTEGFSRLISHIQQCCENLNVTDIATKLQYLPQIHSDSNAQDWSTYQSELEKIMTYRHLNFEWSLELDQIETLTDYLQAVHLLVACLKVIDVSDRKQIERDLLLSVVP